MNRRMVGVSLGVLGLAVAGWLGASVVVGQHAEATLQAFKNAPQEPGGGLRVTRLTHDRGLFSATGEAELEWVAGCAAQPGEDGPVTVKVSYSVSNLILPGRLARFTWQATPAGETAQAFKTMFGATTALSGSGEVAMNGAVRSDLALPELSVQRSGESFQVAPSKGFLTVNDRALAFGWKAGRIVSRGGGMAMEAKDVAIEMDLTNRVLGTGTTRVSAGHISLGVGSLDGVSLRAEATERGQRLDVAIVPAIHHVQANGVDLTDLTLELALKGLDTASVETLSRIFQASCGMQSLTAEEGRQARDAALTLLARGLSVGIPKFSGKGADGAIDGHLIVELVEAKDGKPSLAAQLRSNGQLDIGGHIVPVDRRDMAVSLGFAVANGDGMRAGFEYTDGLLKVNGRALDAGRMLVGLKEADAKMHSVVAGWGQPQQVAEAAEEAPAVAPAPALEAPPAEAPATAPVQAPTLAPAEPEPAKAPAAPAT